MKIRLTILAIALAFGVVMAAFTSIMTVLTVLAVQLLTEHVTPDRGVACVIWGSSVTMCLMVVNLFVIRDKIRTIIQRADRIEGDNQ